MTGTGDDALDGVRQAVESSGLIEPGARVLAMLSGGADSVCLTAVLCTVIGADNVAALHLNHGLRPDAGADEQHCRALCERLGVELGVEALELDAEAAGNLQEQAREARYGVARRVAAERSLEAIATGHTASDQAETVLYRLAASPGRRALLGMTSRSGELVRPLLAVTAEQTRAYCRAAGLEWREDPSNADSRFARARVRHELLPALRRVHPAAEDNVLATRDLLADEAEVLEHATDDALREAGALEPPGALLELARVQHHPRALQRLIVRRLAERAVGASVPLSAVQADAVLALARAPGSGSLDLGGGLRARSEYGVLRFGMARQAGPAPQPATLTVPGSCRFGDWSVTAELAATATAPGDPDEAWLDRGRLEQPLRVCAWSAGDRMRPLGLAGTKTLQDLFTDRRVPRAMRARLPVVWSGDQIAWVAGVAVSEAFRLPDSGGEAVRLRASLAGAAADPA